MQYNEADKESVATLIAYGSSYMEAARAIGATKMTVIRWMREPSFQARIERMQGDMRKVSSLRSQGLTELCWDTIRRQIKKGDGRLALEVLKAAGMTEPDRVDITHRTTSAPDDELEAIRRELVAAAAQGEQGEPDDSDE